MLRQSLMAAEIKNIDCELCRKDLTLNRKYFNKCNGFDTFDSSVNKFNKDLTLDLPLAADDVV